MGARLRSPLSLALLPDLDAFIYGYAACHAQLFCAASIAAAARQSIKVQMCSCKYLHMDAY